MGHDAIKHIESELQKDVAEPLVEDLDISGAAKSALCLLTFNLIAKRNTINAQLEHIQTIVREFEKKV